MQRTSHLSVPLRRVPALGAFTDRQAYRDVLYLLLALPLGVCYFAALVGGVALSLGTLTLWYDVARLEGSGIELIGLTLAGIPIAILAFVRLGVPILRVTGRIARRLAHVERRLTGALLGVEFADLSPPGALGTVEGAASPAPQLSARTMWYLLAKSPVGLCSFAACAGAFMVVGLLLSAPLTYTRFTLEPAPGRQVDSLGEALALSVAGGLLALTVLPALRGLARLSGRFARVMLADSTQRATPNA